MAPLQSLCGWIQEKAIVYGSMIVATVPMLRQVWVFSSSDGWSNTAFAGASR
jgi:hypothetical protein